MVEFGAFVMPRLDAPQETRLLEEMGFDIALFADNQIMARDAYIILTSCTANTRRIRLATANTNPLTRHPSVTASAAASLNEFSDGRAILGIARGDSAVHKIGYPTAPMKLYRSYVEAVRDLLAGKEAEYEGAHFRLEWMSPPVSKPVPVDMAASGPKNLILAGELGDRVSVWVGADPGHLARVVATIREGAIRAHRNPTTVQIGAYLCCFLSDDLRKAREEVRGMAALGVNFFSWDKNVRVEELPPFLAVEAQKLRGHYRLEEHGRNNSTHARLLSDAFIDQYCLIGSVERCVEKLQSIVAQGIQHIYLSIGSFETSSEARRTVLKTFADQILPRFK